MPTRSGVLAYGQSATNQDRVLFTVPPQTTVLVKSALGAAGASATGHLRLACRGAGQFVTLQYIQLSANQQFRWEGWFAIGPGFALELWNNSPGVVQYWLSGAVLPGVIDPWVAALPTADGPGP